MGYPLDVGGVEDYPVKVGSMLLTMVEPHKGFEKAYNRWYERDHYYAGCMIGPFLFAGSRWVATRTLKDLRWPNGGAIANPTDKGSYVAIYWVEKGHHHEHFEEWATPQVHWLYQNGRGFPERSHVHTSMFDHIGSVYRDADPVPVDLALDHGYDGIVALWWDGHSMDAAALHSTLVAEFANDLLKGSPIEIASSWTPTVPDEPPRDTPMDLGSSSGSTNRVIQLLFVGGDVKKATKRVRAYSDAVEKAGVASLLLAAPFLRTVVGTDTYVDELW